ncbi:MAG: hypothetical protein E4G96_08240 [Chrysiogenales bacterium]|nr:MAG: hypothetical protein E4G96_08240 [Chrysiogenales bacterium]
MRAPVSLLAMVLLVACAGLPAIKPETVPEGVSPFLTGSRRLVHSISGTLPGGSTASMIGVIAFDTASGRIRCSLMSIEGLVFLDAEHNGSLVIHRAVGPLSSPDFIMGMIGDIRIMLFAPDGTRVESGRLRDGSPVSRYRTERGMTDLIWRENGETEVAVYGPSQGRERSVRFSAGRRNGVPEKIEFSASGTFGYSLRLDLLDAE